MRKTPTTAHKCLAISTLLLYVISGLGVDWVHALHHHHDNHDGHHHVDHSADAERDICHVAIYHDGDVDCGHSTHVAPEAQECTFCDSVSPGTDALLIFEQPSAVVSQIRISPKTKFEKYRVNEIEFVNRGPPLFV